MKNTFDTSKPNLCPYSVECGLMEYGLMEEQMWSVKIWVTFTIFEARCI